MWMCEPGAAQAPQLSLACLFFLFCASCSLLFPALDLSAVTSKQHTTGSQHRRGSSRG